MTSGQRMVGDRADDDGRHVLRRRVRVRDDKDEPRDDRADRATDDVLKHRSLLPDHLADGHTVPRSIP